jgi:hypothetical protein
LLINAASADEIANRRTVRSIAAESAEVLRLHSADKVSDLYTNEMKQNAREQLQDLDTNARKTDPALHQAISESVTALDHNDGGALRSIAERLYKMAGPRGPAS